MTFSIRELRNSRLFSSIVVYRYLCETWKRERPHEVNPISDRAVLKRHTDILLFKQYRSSIFKQYVLPIRGLYHRRKYNTVYNRIDQYSYERLTTIYKVTMHPQLNNVDHTEVYYD